MWNSDRRLAAPGLRALGALLPLLLCLGCVEHTLVEFARGPEPFPVASPPPPPSDGAIWRGGTASGSFLYFDRKARGVGDLVTVLVAESVSAEGSANTQLGKNQGYSASLTSDIGFTDLLQEGAEKIFNLFGVDGGGDAEPGTTVNVVDAEGASNFTGDGQTSRSGSFAAVITCRVIQALPGGLLHIRGRRQIVVNHDLQMITVEGLVRREDISINNTVASTALADARLTYDGIGVIDDKQRPSLVSRLMDWIYPF